MSGWLSPDSRNSGLEINLSQKIKNDIEANAPLTQQLSQLIYTLFWIRIVRGGFEVGSIDQGSTHFILILRDPGSISTHDQVTLPEPRLQAQSFRPKVKSSNGEG
jgi:hypothetical protein